jgi:hypothetical protein
MKKTEQELMEEDFKSAYGIIHQYMININIARVQGRDVVQQERGSHLLRVALMDYEKKIKEDMGIEDEPDEENI